MDWHTDLPKYENYRRNEMVIIVLKDGVVGCYPVFNPRTKELAFYTDLENIFHIEDVICWTEMPEIENDTNIK